MLSWDLRKNSKSHFILISLNEMVDIVTDDFLSVQRSFGHAKQMNLILKFTLKSNWIVKPSVLYIIYIYNIFYFIHIHKNQLDY